MKAVNLLPREAQRSFGAIRGLGSGTTALLSALALGIVVAAAYVVVANNVTDKQDQLAKVNALQASADQQASKLKPYADLDQARTQLLDRVKTLAGGRYDWPQTLDRVARALPAEAKLTQLDGSAASAEAAPQIQLSGCTGSHDGVAALIDRLRAVKGIAGVSLQSSTIADSGTGGEPAACPGKETFQMTLQLEGSPVAGAVAGATGTGTGTSATPAPTSTTPAPGASTPTTTNAAPAGGS